LLICPTPPKWYANIWGEKKRVESCNSKTHTDPGASDTRPSNRSCIKAAAGSSSLKLQIFIHLSFYFHPRPIMKAAAAAQLFFYFHLEEIFN
jgi:hypothetical protein